MIGFYNDRADCSWLSKCHLTGSEKPFRSYLIEGNEDAPDMVLLYASSDPDIDDPYTRITFLEGEITSITYINSDQDAVKLVAAKNKKLATYAKIHKALESWTEVEA